MQGPDFVFIPKDQGSFWTIGVNKKNKEEVFVRFNPNITQKTLPAKAKVPGIFGRFNFAQIPVRKVEV